MKQTKVEVKNLETSFGGSVGHVVSTVGERESLVKPKKGDIGNLRRKLVVMICSATLILEGVNLSLPGPFFPTEAEKKGS